MQHEYRITVLDTKVFPELQERYLADPKSGLCPFFKKGDTFLLKRNHEQDDFYHLMSGRFCGEAWDAVSRYVYTALQGGSIMHKWTKDERMMISVVKSPSIISRAAVWVSFPLRSAAGVRRISRRTSSSRSPAVSGYLPHTPARTHPVFPAVC